MKSKKHGRKEKTMGPIGRRRAILIQIPVTLYVLLNFLIAAGIGLITVLLLVERVGTLAISCGLLAGVLAVMAYNFIGVRWALSQKEFYSRPMTNEEYERFKGRNLIHYTNKLTVQDFEDYNASGKIRLAASIRDSVNYTMLPQDRGKGFVWFHLSDEDGSDEPDFESYWYTHSTEGYPRSYKVIVTLFSLPRDRLLFRPMDGAVSFHGEYEGPALVFTNFRWYADRVYFWKCLHFPYAWSFLMFLAAYRQLSGGMKWHIRKLTGHKGNSPDW